MVAKGTPEIVIVIVTKYLHHTKTDRDLAVEVRDVIHGGIRHVLPIHVTTNGKCSPSLQFQISITQSDDTLVTVHHQLNLIKCDVSRRFQRYETQRIHIFPPKYKLRLPKVRLSVRVGMSKSRL